MKTQTTTIATVNNIPILIIENGEKLIPIRPICDALGIDSKSQREKIESDEFLNSVAVLSPSTGADNKIYEMTCIPYKYVFGWLFTINPKNVKPEAQEAVSRYRTQCYEVLFRHFSDQSDFLEQKQKALELQLEKEQEVRSDFRNTQKTLKEATTRLNVIKDTTFEYWLANHRQF
ncbi:chromosome partitioning protein ParA [Adhaeribacter arboris]|uniref:Chromosome partitioning protein ParA n=1 Tax=Adhaeribacter arboris TaxID=2072846 RepID=A0A2T2YMJ2_9BACT|nr:phage antirepressor N-terminal domain-containing protein [Adhaeribacter arboris]PSR56728.1 chromosome partitioning protein ParA [Adhaeribacter arboris]